MSNVVTNCGTITPNVFDVIKFDVPSVTDSHIPYFHSLMCSWALNVAMPFSWVVVIDAQNKDNLLSQISNMPQYEPGSWDTSEAINNTWTDQTQDIIGCIFAQGVTLPGEELMIERAGITEGSKNGYINAPIANGRSDFMPLQISFLETNRSFADGVLRPWNILVSHQGLIAQSSSIKANIHVYQLAKNGEENTNIIRKAWTFFDCVPTQITSEELTYSPNDFGKRQIYFTYNYYTLVA